MLHQHSYKYPFILLVLIFFITACSKEEEGFVLNEEDRVIYESEETAENLFDALDAITSSAVLYAEQSSDARVVQNPAAEIGCATIGYSPGRLSVDFGEEGCMGPDGKLRQGELVVEFEGSFLTKGFTVWTVLKDFYIDGIKIEGTRKQVNIGLSDGVWSQEISIKEGRITWPNGEYLTRESERLQELSYTPDTNEFELSIMGSASGINLNGVQYRSVISSPLIFKSSCLVNAVYMPSSGSKEISYGDSLKDMVNINYGTGECDSKFTIVSEKGSLDIELEN